MTIRRKQNLSSGLRRKSQFSNRRQSASRGMHLESLEERRMLFGPQLAGIQENSGALLEDGDVLDAAPLEFRMRFDDGQVIDEATVADAIRITRSGFDDAFARASAETDFNTFGGVRVRFDAQQVGDNGNGVRLIFSESDHGDDSLPTVGAFGQVVTIDLNTNSGNESTAADLITAIRANAGASALIAADITSGFTGEVIAGLPLSYSPIVLSGANQATARSSFNLGSSLQLRFTATAVGPTGNDAQLVVSKADLGPNQLPIVTTSGQTVNLILNENSVGATSAGAVANAINNSVSARAIMTAQVEIGSLTRVVTVPPVTYSPISLTGANDEIVRPGFLGIGDQPNEVVVRFGETIPDDRYRIDIVGSGQNPLANEDGLAFNNGMDVTVNFDLDVAPQVRAVVPQPVHRNGNTLTQQRDTIVVHFNNDDLLVENDATGAPTRRSAEHPAFYQLILTNDTATNQDDVVFNPTSVVYDPINDIATLTFADDLSLLEHPGTGEAIGAGTFRLRIGTNEAAFLAPNPVVIDTANDPGGTFSTALDVEAAGTWDTGALIELIGDGSHVVDGQTITLTNAQLDKTDLEFETGFVLGIEQTLTLTFPSDGGQSFNDGDTVVIDDGVQGVTFEFEDAAVGDGTGTNISVVFNKSDDVETVVDALIGAISTTSLFVDPRNLGGGLMHAGTRSIHSLDISNSPITQTGVSAPVSEGETFVFDDGTRVITFEFDDTDTASTVTAGNEPVLFDASMTTAELAVAIRDGIINAGTNLPAAPTSLGNQVHLGGTPTQTLDTNNTGLTQAGQPGVRAGFGLRLPSTAGILNGIGDGDTFTIEDGLGNSAIFEFEDTDVGDGILSGNVEIAFDFSQSLDTIAAAVVTAIDGQNLGLTPVNLGSGRIALGGTDSHTLDLPVGSSLVQEGTPGIAAAVAVDVLPDASFDAGQLGTAIVDAITGDPSIGVQAQLNADGNVQLIGDASVALDATITAVDLAFQSTVISSAIDPQDFPLQLPGAANGISERNIPIQSHLLVQGDTQDGVAQIFYNFRDVYGQDPLGNDLHNTITDAQKERAREVFEFYGHFLGIDFVESEDQGITVVTGDMRAIDPSLPTGPGIPESFSDETRVVMDQQDFSANDDGFGGPWFVAAMREIGRVLGLGPADELPDLTTQNLSSTTAIRNGFPEPVFPGDHSIVHGQHLYRPDVLDVDLYKFVVHDPGVFTAETIAERSRDASPLDSLLTLYKEEVDSDGRVTREVIARNDDYFSEDSFVEIELSGGTYYLGVSASGNSRYNPDVDGSGFGGTSQGAYDLRLKFRPQADESIRDRSQKALDGDADGQDGGQYNFWFRSTNNDGPTDSVGDPQANTWYVDKASGAGDGSLDTPFNNLQTALTSARPGDIVRVLGNPGADNDFGTLGDNLSYDVGFSLVGNGGNGLADGDTLNVPKGVTLMVDSGAIFKLRRARIGVGSSSPNLDRSGGALQVLGAPWIVDAAGDRLRDAGGVAIPGTVYFTSIHDDTIGLDADVNQSPPAPLPGDWGGLSFRGDNDPQTNLENRGLFLNYVAYGDIRYGGGNVFVENDVQVVSPIQFTNQRPTVAYNEISLSADSAMAGNPDAFEETLFSTPQFQHMPFTPDYSRVGPDLRGNRLHDNSINGLLVRVSTPAGGALETLNVAARWDDFDVVHVLAENLPILGTPGGPISLRPPVNDVVLTPLTTGALLEGTYNYRLVFVDGDGIEAAASIATQSQFVDELSSIRLQNLPPVSAGFVSRRIYRSNDNGEGPYTLVREIGGVGDSFVDDGTTVGGTLLDDAPSLRARLDGRLAIDPRTVVKFNGASIETQIGAQFLAEGTAGREVIFTSILDDEYGAGGTFDTTNDENASTPGPGNWGGLFFGHLSDASVDHSRIAYGGGSTKVAGGFTSFSAVEIHQANARLTNSTIINNDDGIDPIQVQDGRDDRGDNRPSIIFVRGAQPVIANNLIRDNQIEETADDAELALPIISMDVNSLNGRLVVDWGRSTGVLDAISLYRDNQGPLIRGNVMSNNGLNAVEIRPGTLTTQGVLDDTDIVHVVRDTIVVPDFHVYGGMRLESSATESLVVKLHGENAGFTVAGKALDYNDRIGGSLQVVGQPGRPVVITAVLDGSVGAGFEPDGSPLVHTIREQFSDINALPFIPPTDPEVPGAFANLIDNDIAPGVPGQFAFRADDAGASGTAVANGIGGGITAQDLNGTIYSNIDVIFEFFNYVDIGGDGQGGLRLNTDTNVNQVATLVADDVVVSTGDFAGENGTIDWEVESTMLDGVPIVFNKVKFTSSQPFGELQFINYLDEDVFGVLDDILFTRGTPGFDDFRAFTIDDALRFGFSQGGKLTPGTTELFVEKGTPLYDFTLEGATYDGWTADEYIDLQVDIETGGVITYDPIGTIDTVALPPFTDPTLGPAFGPADVTTAFAWTLDPSGTEATITTLLELVPQEPVESLAGDWFGLELDVFANDRNVQIVTEGEAPGLPGEGVNDTPGTSQVLGALAVDQKSGDDNLRLGFELHGSLDRPSDVDVYSFEGTAGTEVWIDLDRTSQELDSVVELIGSDGSILAISDNSAAETNDPSLLESLSSLPSGRVNRLQRSQFVDPDHYSTNLGDAGMRVALPGAPGTPNTYYIRVRSSNLGPGDSRDRLIDPDAVTEGRSAGVYQLQIRLQETDEVPGSTFQYSDIRFATNGISIVGQPAHSPLLGEAAEIPGVNNDDILASQLIGNILTTDGAVISTAGDLFSPTDVDFFGFDVEYQDFEFIPGVTNPNRHATLTLEVDYADGTGRANTNASIFDANGNLIYIGGDSNIGEDRPGPLSGANVDDLSHGTIGPLDPFIGPFTLPENPIGLGTEGPTYFVAISSAAQIPEDLEQFLLETPAPGAELVRLEPNNSIARIAEDHIETQGGGTADPPQIPVLIDDASIVPFTLGDVVLLVSQDPGPVDTTNVYTVDPLTGEVETIVGRFNRDVGDIELRPNGDLHAFSKDDEDGTATDARAGNYLQIDTGTAAITLIDDDQVEVFVEDPANPATPVVAGQAGVHYEGLAYTTIGGVQRGFVIGNRFPGNGIAPQFEDNILFEFDPDTGIVTSAPQADRTGGLILVTGPGTDKVERGVLDTSRDLAGTANTTIVTREATTVDRAGNTISNITDGLQFGLENGGPGSTPVVFEFNTGPEVTFDVDPANDLFVRDGDVFSLDAIDYEFNTGSVIVVEANSGSDIGDGDTITITDNQSPARTKVFEFDTGDGITSDVAIAYNFGSTPAELVDLIVEAINDTSDFSVEAQQLPNSNRITLTQDSASTGATASSSGIDIQGDPSFAARNSIRVEETFDDVAFGQAIANSIAINPTASVDGSRINFAGATTGTFDEIVARGVFTDVGSDGLTSPGTVAVPFLAAASASQIADAIKTAIDSAVSTGFFTRPVSSTSLQNVVTITGEKVAFVDPPLQAGGAAPGGIISGMTFVGSDLYGVSDRGGLFRIDDYTSGTTDAEAVYITTSSALLGIEFSGLTTGPPNVEGGRFADMLFGLDSDGMLYAFDTAGFLQPVFADGQSSIPTGLSDANGLTFSNLDYNLWHVTDNRDTDAGHGVNAAFDGSTAASSGGSSLYFGFESQAANGAVIDPDNDPGNSFDYDFPGGAHGTIETNAFSLAGYSPDDSPVLYFNYFAETENASAELGNGFMRDAFRVFIGGDDGDWHLLATNNSFRGSADDDDEFDLGTGIQQLFDNTGTWRQVRVPLDAFAGQENLQLRFDFSTAGSMNTGDPNGTFTTGDELRAIPGSELRDGDQILIDSDVFEIDQSYTFVVPSGAAVEDGAQFIVDGIKFEFDDTVNSPGTTIDFVPVEFNTEQPAETVAFNIAQTILANQPLVEALFGDLSNASEENDTLLTGVSSGITGQSATFFASGRIGDNDNLAFEPGRDVDMIQVNLEAGDLIEVDIDADVNNSPLDALLRIFNSGGEEVASDDNTDGFDPFVSYVAPVDGTYYVGISTGENFDYDPLVEGSGTAFAGSGGFYDVLVDVVDFLDAIPRDNRVNVIGVQSVTLLGGLNSVFLEGAPGVSSGSIPIITDAGMDPFDVAGAVTQSLNQFYGDSVAGSFRQYGEFVRVVGHNVGDAGPLGLTDSLPGDEFGSFFASTAFDGSTSATDPGALRAQANAFEGIYIDDLVIGFAERGEMVSGATGSSNFVQDPILPANQILTGPYQFELRRATDTGVSADPTSTASFALTETFDTNDRLARGVTLVIPAAHEIIDGQSFTLNDGINRVRFEFDDASLLTGNPRLGVATGSIRVPFDPAVGSSTAEPSEVIARRVRDLINSPNVQALIEVTAAGVGGEENGPLSSNELNLFGNASLEVLAANVLTGDLTVEGNDTTLDALDSGVQPAIPASFSTSGTIGDNPNLIANNAPLDVDLVELNLVAGTRVLVDVDANEAGGNLDGVLRLFNLRGDELAVNDNAPAPGEELSLDPYIDFIVPKTDTYFVGVSAANNDSYDIQVEGSGAGALGLGDYSLDIDVQTGGIAFTDYDLFGDSNTDRAQGQFIIANNRITNVAEAGILVTPGPRIGPGMLPYPGPTRNLLELNPAHLVPGVTITNNIISGAGETAISISGSPPTLDLVGNPVPEVQAPVPFARIVNNTLVGGMIELPPPTPPISIDGVTFPQGSRAFADAVQVYRPLIGGGPAPGNNFQDLRTILGEPDYVDPGNGLTNPRQALSLGRGGEVVVELRDNQLTGSGDSRDDLFIVEVGNPEAIDVEVSADGVNFVSVGSTPGGAAGIDIDAFGFDTDDSFTFIKITDVKDDGSQAGPSVGADIDAVGTLNDAAPFIFRSGGVGVDVTNNASPTLLNNIIVNFETGITIDDTSDTTVVGGTLYQRNDEDTVTPNDIIGLGSFPIELDKGASLFVQPALGNFYLAPGSRAIDSGIDSLEDRPELVTVKEPIGVGRSPILAPAGDQTGQSRVDDPAVSPPPGIGANLFRDRGAIDRADFVGPTGVVHSPADNGPTDLDPNFNFVLTTGVSLPQFTIQLADGVQPVDPIDGSGPDASTVTSNAVRLFQEDELLIDGIDYTFRYDEANGFIRLTPVAGLWPIDNQYRIEIANSDRFEINAPAGNQINDGDFFIIDDANLTDGSARFEFDTGYILNVPSGLSIQDAEQFTIVSSGFDVTFEFDSSGRFDPANEIIRFDSTSTTDEVTNAVAAAINASAIPLTANVIGSGEIHLGGQTSDVISLGLAPSLALTGRPGTGLSTPVPIVPSNDVTAEDVAAAIADAVNNESSLANVSARVDGAQVIVEGASLVQGLGDPALINGVRDIAGNDLKPNTADGRTVFNILLGSGLDFGDAPESYGTLSADNGARHSIVDGVQLGADIDIDFDGQPTDAADGDGADDDGVVGLDTLFKAFPTTIDVTATSDGVLSAWIDFDGNGTFDLDEAIINSQDVVPGLNQFTVTPPTTSQTGPTFARFRVSTLGVTGPIGPAADGEVEDYAITIATNPNTNPVNPLDVNADGFVSPIDALIVINELNDGGSRPLGIPPLPFNGPFLDANSDGALAPIDALLIIGALNSRSQGEGEGEDGPEGEFSGTLEVTAAPVAGANLAGAWVEDESEAEGEPADVVAPANLPELVGQQSVDSVISQQGPLSLSDIDDTINDLVEDDEELNSEQSAHDDFFANIHFG